jgi:hypothetical protein
MVSACRDAGLATPVFEEIGVRYRVTLSITQVQEPTLDKRATQQAGQVAQNSSDYQRAMVACVEGRGYSAR